MLLVLIIFAIGIWIALGSQILGISSFFASFLFLWYWSTVEKVDFARWVPSLVGALVGVLLAWSPKILADLIGPAGGILALVLIIVALFCTIMNWLPLALNGSAMLYLTVFGAPLLLADMDPPRVGELFIAIIGGAIFFAGVVKFALSLIHISEPTRPY